MKGTQIIASQGRPSNNRSWPKSTPTDFGDGVSQDKIKSDGTDYIGKSFEEHVSGYPIIVDGVNESEVLLDIVKSMAETLEEFELKINHQIDQAFTDSAEFDHELGKSVLGIGQGVIEMGSRVQTLENFDVSKSLNAQADQFTPGQELPSGFTYLDKSIPNQGGEMEYDKQEVLDAMMKAHYAGAGVSELDILRFDDSGEISDSVKKSIGIV